MNRTVSAVFLVGVVLLLTFAGCQKQTGEVPAGKTKVTILAAASLRECVDEIVRESGPEFTAEFDISTGASSSLAQQIQAGAGADLFLSANGEWAQAVMDQFPAAEKKIVAGNTLVLVAPPGSQLQGESLAAVSGNVELRIGIAGPEVPAGKYSRQTLASAGMLDGLIQGNRLIVGQDVRQVLRWVELGEVDVGLVYRTDVAVASSVRTLLDIDPKTHDPVEYWLVLLNRPGNSNDSAKKMYERFSSDRVGEILIKRGFLLPQ